MNTVRWAIQDFSAEGLVVLKRRFLTAGEHPGVLAIVDDELRRRRCSLLG